MGRRAVVDVFDFSGAMAPPDVGSADGGRWVRSVDAAAGSPTILADADGLTLAFSATAEIQNLSLYWGDVLYYDIDDLIRFECWVKTVAALDTTTSIAFGMTSARNDAIDSIAEAALFRLIGNNNVLVETDDGTNNNDDVAAGLTLGAAYKHFAIDFSERVSTQEPPSLSLPGKSHVGFYMGNAQGSLRRVASGTRFDMSNYTGGLQPFFQIQKTSDTNADKLSVRRVEITRKEPLYS